MLFCFITTGSDDSACEAKESCGNLHRSAKKESFPKREAFIRELSAATRRWLYVTNLNACFSVSKLPAAMIPLAKQRNHAVTCTVPRKKKASQKEKLSYANRLRRPAADDM